MASFAGKLVLGPVSPDCKPVVVGIDFGTAYSGVAIAYRADPGTVISTAPTAKDVTQTKVPTALLLMEDGSWEFGHDAESKYSEKLNATIDKKQHPVHLFKRFKMELKGQNSGFETLTAASVDGVRHSLMDLITVSLQKLKEHAMARITAGFAQGLNAKTDVQWVLTVPAIWNDFGKSFMRKAAFKAGMMEDELSDNLILVLEPEGAALAVHVGQVAFDVLNVGSRFMVLDCGGGTIDITVHEVRSIDPLKMRAIAIPTGGDWGGDYVNVEFKKFLKELLGELYLENESPYEFYNINVDFDNIKKMFDPTKDPPNIRLADVLENKKQMVALAEAYNAKHPKTPILNSPTLRNGFLPMSKELMLSHFEPLLQQMVTATRRVLTDIPDIKTIMVVGGFGSSQVVTGRIRSEFHDKNGVKVIMPDPTPKPQAAIVQGAVYFGLHKNIIDSRLSPFTYGIAMQINGVPNSFKVLVRKGQELPEDHVVEEVGQPGSPTLTTLTWRIFRSDLEKPTTVKGELLLGTVTAQCPPNPNNAMRTQRGRFMFGGPEIKVVIKNAVGQEYKVAIKPQN